MRRRLSIEIHSGKLYGSLSHKEVSIIYKPKKHRKFKWSSLFKIFKWRKSKTQVSIEINSADYEPVLYSDEQSYDEFSIINEESSQKDQKDQKDFENDFTAQSYQKNLANDFKTQSFSWMEMSYKEYPVSENQCPICLETYDKDPICYLLECNHMAHGYCLDKWWNSTKKKQCFFHCIVQINYLVCISTTFWISTIISSMLNLIDDQHFLNGIMSKCFNLIVHVGIPIILSSNSLYL